MKVFHLNITTLLKVQKMEEWLALMPEAISRQIQRYRFEKDRLRVLGGKLLLRHALNEEKGYTLSDLQKSDKGRLYFSRAPFDFNISHSGDMTILAFSTHNRIGIDIEMHRKIGYEHFRRNFTESEWQRIMSAHDGAGQFFDLWSIKESVIKADGRGIEVLSNTSVQDDLETAFCDGKRWLIKPLKIADGYSACSAMETDEKIELIPVAPEKLT